ncbi:MAG TPA: hypothetical protein VNM92_06215 [Thermoanaerobaculia bacterium]|nr:hypothetical protein [Thermoanaerobaculia bacterium]
MRQAILLTVLFALSFVSAAFGQLSEADQAYLDRGQGIQSGRPATANIDAAIAGYQRAIVQRPDDLESRWKLLRALRYKGSYVAATKDQKRKVFEQARTVGAESLQIFDKMLAARGAGPVARTAEKRVADAARQIPHAGQLLYWDAVSWGEWAQVYGKLAAVKEGVADRIRRESTIVMMIDPKIEGGGGARVLGRLHNQTPRVPFLTGWASGSEAVKYLRQSLAEDPTNKITQVFLAEAMFAADKATKAKAVQMLRDVIGAPNDASYAAEHAGAQQDARNLLKQWGEN